jgi:hypothetical protein
MREITSHKENTVNDTLTIKVTDEPGAGGANHRYLIQGFDRRHNPSGVMQMNGDDYTIVLFQNGPIGEAGVNGITQEALLAIVVDRLDSFQAGRFQCHENEMALLHAREALEWLKARTRSRMERGVEGKSAA